jgi:acid phosphatase type 7
MSIRGIVLLGGGLLGAVAWAQQSMTEAETNALAVIRAQRTDGLIAVQPWTQLVGTGKLGVGWLTSGAADGVVEWTQSEAGDAWRQAWFSEDGLRQANSLVQRAVIDGYDPARPIRLRARSRAITSFKPYSVTFGETAASQERRFPALTRPHGAVSFIVFNDTHNRVPLYPLLTEKAGVPVDFAVLNGDALQDPQTEGELTDYLLLPMAWFASKSIPCFFLRGNHETRGAFARRMKDYLILPAGRYYAAMTFGATRVLFLDTGEDKPDTDKEYSGLVDFEPYIEEELAWLRGEIAGEAFQQAAWRLVVMHIPPDWRREEAKLGRGERRVRERFAPLFDAGRITAVISGHNHIAEVIEPSPDASRGFQWAVFLGGASSLTNATAIRVDSDVAALKITRIASDGTVGAERTWKR